ncbi:MAG: dTDP-4-dehydrorhamnose 3,5-epimerase [bacterium]|nr:dTDP-4-dehydrorhamnose 3,5-epimerase [bacterium]
MEVEKTPLEGLLIIHPRVFADPRGFLYESYNEAKFRQAGLNTDWRQDNHTFSVKNSLRGMHFQRGEGQVKLVRCTQGRVWDVAVDIRPESPTLGQWFAIELSAENKRMLYLARGFAHGYVVLSDGAEIIYKCSSVYHGELEDQIKWDDPRIGIDWPVRHPIISERDQTAQSFSHYLATVRPRVA